MTLARRLNPGIRVSVFIHVAERRLNPGSGVATRREQIRRCDPALKGRAKAIPTLRVEDSFAQINEHQMTPPAPNTLTPPIAQPHQVPVGYAPRLQS